MKDLNKILSFGFAMLTFAAFIFTSCQREENFLAESTAIPTSSNVITNQKFSKTLVLFDQEQLNSVTLKVTTDDQSKLDAITMNTFELKPLLAVTNKKNGLAERKKDIEQLEWNNESVTVEITSKDLQQHAYGFSLDYQGNDAYASFGWIKFIFNFIEKVDVEACEGYNFDALFNHVVCNGTEEVRDAAFSNVGYVSFTHNSAKKQMVVYVNGDCFTTDIYNLSSCSCGSSSNNLMLPTQQNLSLLTKTLNGTTRDIINIYINNMGEINRIIHSDSDKPQYQIVRSTLKEFWQVNKDLINYGFETDSEERVLAENLAITKRLLTEVSKATESLELKKAIMAITANLGNMEGKNIKEAIISFDNQPIQLR